MKKYIYSLLVICATLSWSCKDEVIGPFSGGDLDTVNAILDGTAKGDPFSILSLKIENGKLRLKVQYGGGCEDHEFALIWNGNCDSDDFAQRAQFAIIHDSNGDLCEALITEEIVLDYNTAFTGQIFENCVALSFINGSNAEEFLVRDGMQSIVQGRECIMEVELEEAICASGFLGNLWFKSTTASPFLDSDFFYFQPTNIAFDQVFEKGKYMIGVRMVERYEGEEGTCLAYPGPSIPAEILCIESIAD